jgi:uncharacterized protein with PIN domain
MTDKQIQERARDVLRALGNQCHKERCQRCEEKLRSISPIVRSIYLEALEESLTIKTSEIVAKVRELRRIRNRGAGDPEAY